MPIGKASNASWPHTRGIRPPMCPPTMTRTPGTSCSTGTAETAFGGVAAAAQGGDFWEGAGLSFALSSLSYAAHEMREEAWEDASKKPGNTGGDSVGFKGDGRKLAGQWCYSATS